VSTYARHLAESVHALHPSTELSGVDPAAAVSTASTAAAGGWVHLHFTDRLWGADAESAAAAIEAVAAERPFTATLHDVPQPSDRLHFERRAAAYRRVVAAASGVVCNSRHEADLLREFTSGEVSPTVIPLPVAAAHPFARPAELEPEVALLGFYYPGKGHDRVLEAVGRLAATGASDALAAPPRVVALGRASGGHEPDLERMRARAARRGLRFEATGYLSDPELLRRSRRVAVPVIAHDHVSASGSLASWISAGRRPLVVRSRYMEEMAALRPGTLTLVGPEDLAEAIARALADPASTWLSGDESLHPTGRDAVDLYCAFWAEAMAR
jgi:glycosyltransferase involved in cell wall biosynthesis